jgi:3-oxoacid CoA-transferase
VDKVVASPAEAIKDIKDGDSISVTGFGVSSGFPISVLVAIRDNGVKDLEIVSNSLGGVGQLRAMMLVESGQVSRLKVAFSSRPGSRTIVDDMMDNGKLDVELVPQGTLVERLRAGGAGIPAFYTPTGVGSPIADGKELRYFDGKPYIMEHAIKVNFGLVRAWKADKAGNAQFRGASRNFNYAMAKGAHITVLEVDEIVEIGEIKSEDIGLPGIFVDRVVLATIPPDPPSSSDRRAADVPKQYNGKPAWTRSEIARQASLLFPEGSYVNLGTGIPTLVSNHIEGRDLHLHGENGILGYGKTVSGPDVDNDIFNASGQHVAKKDGASYFDSVTAFEMARGGHIDFVVLGAYQVDQEGNLANYTTPEMSGGGIGGAMDLVAGKKCLVITMEHQDSKGRHKLVKKTDYPLTGPKCVDVVVTDLAVLRRTEGKKWQIEKVAEGFTPEEIVELTGMEVSIAPALAGTSA